MLRVLGKFKFGDYWKTVSVDLTEKEITKTYFLNFRRSHQYESEALVYFNKEAKYNAKKCSYFSYAKISIFAVSPEGLVSHNLLIEIKTRAAGSAGPPLQDLRKNSYLFIHIQLPMECAGIKIALSSLTILSLQMPIIVWLRNAICYRMLLKL